jgi:hypothetical protein
MGFYSGSSTPSPDQEPRGCREVLILTRAAFGVLLIPMGILLGAIFTVILLVYLFGKSWILGVLGLAVLAAGIYLYARWERRHFGGP